MPKPELHIRRHYSGLFIGHCADEPDLMVMGQDHEEVQQLAEQEFAARWARNLKASEALPKSLA